MRVICIKYLEILLILKKDIIIIVIIIVKAKYGFNDILRIIKSLTTQIVHKYYTTEIIDLFIGICYILSSLLCLIVIKA